MWHFFFRGGGRDKKEPRPPNSCTNRDNLKRSKAEAELQISSGQFGKRALQTAETKDHLALHAPETKDHLVLDLPERNHKKLCSSNSCTNSNKLMGLQNEEEDNSQSCYRSIPLNLFTPQ